MLHIPGENKGAAISEVAEKDSCEEQIVDTELEVLKVQLDNLGKDHQKQLEALQTIKKTRTQGKSDVNCNCNCK